MTSTSIAERCTTAFAFGSDIDLLMVRHGPIVILDDDNTMKGLMVEAD